MNYFDVIVVIPLVWALYKGFKKGLIIEIASLLALILGIYGGLNFSNYAADWMTEHWEVSTKMLPILSFTVTFLGIIIVVFSLAKLIERVVKLVALGLVNRLMGALFGFLKVTLICSTLLYIVDTFDYKYSFISNDFREDSMLYEPLTKVTPTIMPLFTKWKLMDVDEVVMPMAP